MYVMIEQLRINVNDAERTKTDLQNRETILKRENKDWEEKFEALNVKFHNVRDELSSVRRETEKVILLVITKLNGIYNRLFVHFSGL